MRARPRPPKLIGSGQRTVVRRKEPILSHLVSKVAVALAEIEAIHETRGHTVSKSRGRMVMYPAE